MHCFGTLSIPFLSYVADSLKNVLFLVTDGGGISNSCCLSPSSLHLSIYLLHIFVIRCLEFEECIVLVPDELPTSAVFHLHRCIFPFTFSIRSSYAALSLKSLLYLVTESLPTKSSCISPSSLHLSIYFLCSQF